MTSLHGVFVLFLVISHPKECLGQYSQTLAVPYEVESNCTGNEYFNARTLSCQPCSSGTVPTPSKLSCQCPPGSIINEITPVGIQCQACPAGTQPNIDGTACQPCSTLDCFCKTTPSLCEASQTLPLVDPMIHLLSGVAVRSTFVASLLEPTASKCSAGSEVDCQALVNLCVLQNFDTSDGTACDAVENIRSHQPEGPAPALFFLGDTDTELHRDPAILQHFMFGGGPAGKLDILLTR
ncbi:hypothetical protein TELCIR_06693 [Teladorsagia circumcincta]|uniref:GCC2 and GCC3 n=1 Tax=Teladorsagia circumcincta TaxID=45464 RepID=A0A2G9UMB2_TELCI|nr:hypothetical protein TELCIR_06693 [Teladorsagia circumcincta]